MDLNAILLKFGGVTVGTHTCKQYNIQVARDNGYETIRSMKMHYRPKI